MWIAACRASRRDTERSGSSLGAFNTAALHLFVQDKEARLETNPGDRTNYKISNALSRGILFVLSLGLAGLYRQGMDAVPQFLL